MIKLVSSFKPGRYVRRQIVCQGMWVDVEGFLLLPFGKGARKWIGLARVRRSHVPTPQPMAFIRHDSHGGTLRANYDPITRRMRFTNNNGAAVTFTLMK